MAASPTTARPAAAARRSAWLKTLMQWHWISSATCLVGMLLFAFTGITLNHASKIESTPQVRTRTEALPPALLALVAPAANEPDKRAAPLPPPLRAWLAERLQVDAGEREAEWTREEIYLALPRPGGDAWVRIARDAGEVEAEDTDRGWIAWLNDLHKGRHAGTAWAAFIDVFAVACLVFCVTGLMILKLHAANRPTTWPLVGLGLVVPALLALLLVH